MKNKAYDLSSYSFSAGEKILLDTNIWLYLFPAPVNTYNRFAAQYSAAFAKLVAARVQPVLDPVVLSEYLNRYARIEWDGKYKKNYPIFKDFRKSEDFAQVAQSAEIFTKKILTCCQVHSVAADTLDLHQALNAFTAGGMDFNDALLIDVCTKYNCKLMTNDSDFQEGGIEILTTHPKLLKACRP